MDVFPECVLDNKAILCLLWNVLGIMVRWFREKNRYQLEESTKLGTQALYDMVNKFSLGAT